jgi:protein gp37
MRRSKIEWTESTWNPATGCTKISAGCANCYAFNMARRLKAMGSEKYANGFDLTLHPDVLSEPYGWRRPRTVFVNSMSDLFHEDIPDSFISYVFRVMNENPRHTFQVLTKRAERLAMITDKLQWSKNIWMGVTVENSTYKYRFDSLKYTGANVKFLSLEPLLGPLGILNLQGIDWVIVGGESGPKARPVLEEWVLEIKGQCIEQQIPFFFKQWGGKNKKKNGRLLQGQVYSEMPVTGY